MSSATVLLFLLLQVTPAQQSNGSPGSDPSTKPPPAAGASETQPAPIDELPVSLTRIQRALSNPTALKVYDPVMRDGRPVYRVDIEGERIDMQTLLGKESLRGAVPYGGMTHQEFLDMVTPDDVRGYAAFSNARGDHRRGHVDRAAVGGPEGDRRRSRKRRTRASRKRREKKSKRRSKRCARRGAPPGCPRSSAAATFPRQKPLDLGDRPRHTAREPLQSRLSQQERIFDPHADVPILLHHRPHLLDEGEVLGRLGKVVERGLSDVDAGFDDERHARAEWPSARRHRALPCRSSATRRGSTRS